MMQLVRFKVRGFKNFRDEMCLDELGPLNIIHGNNNVGKSNLLEALLLFFQMGAFVCKNTPGHAVSMNYDSRTDSTMSSEQVFNREGPDAIELEGEFRTTRDSEGNQRSRDAISGSKGALVQEFSSVCVQIRLTRQRMGFSLEPVKVSGSAVDSEDDPFWMTSPLARMQPALEQCFCFPYNNQPKMSIVRADRGVTLAALQSAAHDESFTKLSLREQTQLSSRQLAQRLVEAFNSLDPEQVKRWERFRQFVLGFDDIMQADDVLALYDPRRATSFLAILRGSQRIPVHELGTGVQQLLTLFGHLCLADESFVGIEEPELNLRYSLQERLITHLERYTQQEQPRQLFFTSHSPAFESGQYFYGVKLVGNVPTVERRPIKDALQYTGMENLSQAQTTRTQNANSAFISSDGIIRVPERILKELQLPSGGGVVFVPNRETGRIELMTNTQFATLFESKDDEDGDLDP